MRLFPRHDDELHGVERVAGLSSTGRLGVDWTVFGRRDGDGTYRIAYIELKQPEA